MRTMNGVDGIQKLSFIDLHAENIPSNRFWINFFRNVLLSEHMTHDNTHYCPTVTSANKIQVQCFTSNLTIRGNSYVIL